MLIFEQFLKWSKSIFHCDQRVRLLLWAGKLSDNMPLPVLFLNVKHHPLICTQVFFGLLFFTLIKLIHISERKCQHGTFRVRWEKEKFISVLFYLNTMESCYNFLFLLSNIICLKSYYDFKKVHKKQYIALIRKSWYQSWCYNKIQPYIFICGYYTYWFFFPLPNLNLNVNLLLFSNKM